MSIKVMNMVFERYPVGGNEGMLALALADHAHDDGTRIWPSLDSLAHKTKQSRSSVRRHLKVMQDCGWLELVNRTDGRAGGTNEYRINPEWIAGRMTIGEGVNLNPSPGADEAVDNLVEQGAICKGEGVTAVVGEGVTAVAPESSRTVSEPSTTPQPPVETGGRGQPNNRKSEQPPPPSSSERQRWRWTETRSGIEARGMDLGLGRWDERAWPSAGGESFQAYTTRVYVAHLAALGVVSTPQDVRAAISSATGMKDADVLRLMAFRANDKTKRGDAR